jgi:hypothetical protein
MVICLSTCPCSYYYCEQGGKALEKPEAQSPSHLQGLYTSGPKQKLNRDCTQDSRCAITYGSIHLFSRRTANQQHAIIVAQAQKSGPMTAQMVESMLEWKMRKCTRARLSNDKVVTRRDSSGSSTVFPQTLYDMLFILEMEYGAAAAIAWQPHGRCFLIRDKGTFVERIMPL